MRVLPSKETVERAEIEKDIACALKNPPHSSEASYKNLTLPAVIIAAVLLAVEFVYPAFVLWALGAIVVFYVRCCYIQPHPHQNSDQKPIS